MVLVQAYGNIHSGAALSSYIHSATIISILYSARHFVLMYICIIAFASGLKRFSLRARFPRGISVYFIFLPFLGHYQETSGSLPEKGASRRQRVAVGLIVWQMPALSAGTTGPPSTTKRKGWRETNDQ